MASRTACIIGGAGFVGRYLSRRLVRDGWRVRIPTRRRERNRDLLVLPTAELIQADVFDPATLNELFDGCDVAINMVGILNESRRMSFKRAHVELPKMILQACLDTGVPRLLHMSALHADQARGRSLYLRTKGEGENHVHQVAASNLHVTSFRPSVIFGPGDSFFNRFADVLRLTPGVMPLACAGARFAPVYVGDVAHCFAASIDDKRTWNGHYDLCGPESYTLRELVEYTARVAGMKRRIVGLGDGLSKLQGRVMQNLPGKLFTMDNYLSMQVDSVCSGDFPEVFGIRPAAIDTVVPGYLAQAGQRGRYAQLRQAQRGD